MGRAGAVLAVVMLIIIATSANAQDQAVPNQQAQAEARRQLREVFGAEMTQRDPAGRAALANVMVQRAEEEPDSAAGYVMLDMARELAASAGDAWLAFEAIDQLAGTFDVEAQALKREAFETAGRTARSPDAAERTARAGMRLVDSLLEQGDYEQAGRIAADLRGLAGRARDADLAERVKQLTRQVRSIRTEYNRVRSFMDQLLENPDDAEAAGRVGRFYALTLGDWDRALPLLARSEDNQLKELAKADMASPTDPQKQADLADEYWQVAGRLGGDDREALRQRARYWYRQAYEKLEGVRKDLALQRAASPDARAYGDMRLEPGLVGEYFNDARWGDRVFVRIDEVIDFIWPPGKRPHARIGPAFSVRWRGYLMAPKTGYYWIDMVANDRGTLWVNGQIAALGNSQTLTRVYLYEGPNELRIEFRESGKHGSARLSWSRSDDPQSTQLVEPQYLVHDLSQAVR
jgi:hypothetical protein